METSDEARIEALLRAARPAPDPAWEARLERRLLPPRRVLHRPRPLMLGGAAAAGLAGFTLALGLAGVGPFDGGTSDVRATDQCRWITVLQARRVPELVLGARGAPEIRYRLRDVRRPVRRCG